jgi:hypothetical protein
MLHFRSQAGLGVFLSHGPFQLALVLDLT